MLMRVLRLGAAVLLVAVVAGGCATPAQKGAAVGAALGAATGAVVGHQQGHRDEGAVVGALAGGLAGALVGDQIGQRGQAQQTQAPAQSVAPSGSGHWETRTVTAPSGERYEERVWVAGR